MRDYWFFCPGNIRRDRDFNLAQMGDNRHTLTSLNTVLLDAAERESTNEFCPVPDKIDNETRERYGENARQTKVLHP